MRITRNKGAVFAIFLATLLSMSALHSSFAITCKARHNEAANPRVTSRNELQSGKVKFAELAYHEVQLLSFDFSANLEIDGHCRNYFKSPSQVGRYNLFPSQTASFSTTNGPRSIRQALSDPGSTNPIRPSQPVRTIASPAQSSDTITYTYDSLNRLTSATYANGDQVTYSYDAVGNRTSIQVTTNNGGTNDNFADAQVISGSSGSASGTNVGATKESGEPNHAGDAGGASVWYRWQAPTTGSSIFSTAGSSFDTLLAVYTGSSVNALTTIASDDDDPAGGLQSVVTFNAIAGTVYYIAVDGFAGSRGNITLSWGLSVPPSSLRIDGTTQAAGRATGGQQIILFGTFANLSSVIVGGTAASWSYTSGISQITVITPPHTVGAAKIDLVPTTGATYTRSNAFAYLPTVFTDNTLVAGITQAKAQHVIELRQPVDALRAVAGLGPAPWTDPTLSPFSSIIRAAHILELRLFLEDAASRLGYSPGNYSDPGLTSGFVIRRVHIEELRQRIRTIAG
jgi:YD repeat-containing protein